MQMPQFKLWYTDASCDMHVAVVMVVQMVALAVHTVLDEQPCRRVVGRCTHTTATTRLDLVMPAMP